MQRAWVAIIYLLAACSPAPTLSPPISTTPPTARFTSTPAPTQTPGAWWQPAAGESWQIQFTGESIDTRLDVDVYDLDLFDTPVEVIDGLHARGAQVMCYLNAGAWEDWRPDAASFDGEVVGRDYEGWPGERWLDISNVEALAPIILARLDLCASKGFDGVDPDNLDGFNVDTGFDLNAEDAAAYVRWLAEQAHARGLGIGIKNVPELAAQLEPHVDWALTESCFAQGWCEDMLTFIQNGKPVFAIEYVEEGMSLEDFCSGATQLGFSAILKTQALDGWADFCP
ncbi:MAG: endo alpha-1,4 polygalactosaminidase [Anaerolineales bacterium]